MKDKKFIIVTGASMFLLLMMIIFNFGSGPKMTYSATGTCPSGYSFAKYGDNTNKCCPSGYEYYFNSFSTSLGSFPAGCYGNYKSSYTAVYFDNDSGKCINGSVGLSLDCYGGEGVDPESSSEDELIACENGVQDTENGGCSSCNAGYKLQSDAETSVGICVAISEDNATTCPAGEYLKDGTCTACADGYVSPGGTATSCTQCTNGEVPNSDKSDCVTSSSTTTVTPKLTANVDSDNRIHATLTNVKGCGGKFTITSSGATVTALTNTEVNLGVYIASTATVGAYTAHENATVGTATVTFTPTEHDSGVTCNSVSKTITLFNNASSSSNAITETVCENGGGTWNNDTCSCPTGKTWSTVYKKCTCPIGSKEFDGVCKLAAGISISANKDVLINTTHPVIVSIANGDTCGGKVSVTSSLGNSVSGFNVTASSKTFEYKPTKTGDDTLTFTYSGIDESKCYMGTSKASVTLKVTSDKEAMCEKYYGTWNSDTSTCNCNSGYYWSDTYNKCLAYSSAEDPTRIGPYLQLNWTEKKIKVGGAADLTVCAKVSSSTGADGVAGRYYMSGTNHSGGTMTQMEVPARGCTSVTMYGNSVGTDTVKIEFSPSDSDIYKPVSTTVNICVYDDDSSVCGNGSSGGTSGDGDYTGGNNNTGGNTNTGGNNNTTSNPQTGNIMLFVVWIIGFGGIGYAFWYFKNLKENGV